MEILKQITPRVHAVRVTFQIVPRPGMTIDRFVHVFLIDAPTLAIVDAGVAGATGRTLEAIERIGRQPGDVEHLIFTHAHPDHIGGACELRGRTRARTAAHGQARAWIENVQRQAEQRPVPGFDTLVEGSIPIDQVLSDGDVIDLGDGLTLEVLHTPGHSRGSISLWLPEEGALLSGDAIPLPGDMPIYEDVVASVRSLRRLAAIPAKVLVPSWGEPAAGGAVRSTIEGALGLLQRIHDVVHALTDGDAAPDPIALCTRALDELDLSHVPPNPLLARTFMAHWAARSTRDLTAVPV